MNGGDQDRAGAGGDKPPSMALFRDGMQGPELGSLYREMWRLAWPAFLGYIEAIQG